MTDYAELVARLEDEREELKDCARIRGELSALDPFVAQRFANTMFEAAAAVESLLKERDEARLNYEGALEDCRAAVMVLIRRINGDKDLASASEWVRLNYPSLAHEYLKPPADGE